jgi:hypothetical protein
MQTQPAGPVTGHLERLPSLIEPPSFIEPPSLIEPPLPVEPLADEASSPVEPPPAPLDPPIAMPPVASIPEPPVPAARPPAPTSDVAPPVPVGDGIGSRSYPILPQAANATQPRTIRMEPSRTDV